MTARKPPAKRIPRGTSTTPTTSAAAAAAADQAVPEPVEYDGVQVVFSFTQHLTSRGLLQDKPVEVGGEIFAFRASANAEDNVALISHMQRGDYREAIKLMLVDAEQLDDVLAKLQLPFDLEAEQQLWKDFTVAVSGVRLGDLSAS